MIDLLADSSWTYEPLYGEGGRGEGGGDKDVFQSFKPKVTTVHVLFVFLV